MFLVPSLTLIGRIIISQSHSTPSYAFCKQLTWIRGAQPLTLEQRGAT